MSFILTGILRTLPPHRLARSFRTYMKSIMITVIFAPAVLALASLACTGLYAQKHNAESLPMIMRSGRVASLKAEPSLRNSGFDTTSNSISTPRSCKAAATASWTLSAVPTGTVDFVMMTLRSAINSPMVRATCSTYCRSAEPSSSAGVPTAINRNLHGCQFAVRDHCQSNKVYICS